MVLRTSLLLFPNNKGAGITCCLECRTPDWKFESRQEQQENFFLQSQLNFVCWLLFGVCSTPMLPQWHIKDPSHCAKSADGRLHLNRHTPLTQRSRSELTMLLSRLSVRTYQKRAHTQPVREHSVTVVSACQANVDWFWPKEWNQRVRANLHFKTKTRKKSAGRNE